MPNTVVFMVGGGPAAPLGLCTGLGARWGQVLPPTCWSFQTGLEGALENSPRKAKVLAACALLSPTVKPLPGLSPLLSAGHGPFSTRDGLFAHRLRLLPAGTARAEHTGTAGHTKSEGRGDRGAVCLDAPSALAPSTVSPVLPGQGTSFRDSACCCPSSLPDGGTFGDGAEHISLFLSWNQSIYSFHTLLQ